MFRKESDTSTPQSGSMSRLAAMSRRKSSILVTEEEDVLMEPLLNAQVLHIGHHEGSQSATDKVKRVLELEDQTKPSPRPIFCEMLFFSSCVESKMSNCWKESSRWVKFEETVEEGGTRWSKPHVTLINVQHLLQIKNSLVKGVVILDTPISNFNDVVDICCRSWSKRYAIMLPQMEDIRRMLMASKEHLVRNKHRTLKKGTSNSQTVEDVESGSEDHQRTITKASQNLLRKLPDVSEAAIILVGYSDCASQCLTAFVRLKESRILPDISELPIPTRFVYFLLIPENQQEINAKDIGRCFGTLMVDEIFSQVAYKSNQGYEMGYAVEEFLHQCVMVPAGKWDRSIRWEPPENQQTIERHLEEPSKITDNFLSRLSEEHGADLHRTGRPFGGLMEDVRLKAYWYLSDFTDAFKGRFTQSLAAAIFLFFANISKIITFGGVMDHQLHKQMGAVENVLAGGICGVIYAVFSGQPLCVLSATGPCLVFEVILYNICQYMDWSFLPIRAWVGLWTAVYLLFYVASDASALVAMITRFTEEAFATMISLIFLFKAFDELWEIKKDNPIATDPNKYLADPTCICYVPFDKNTSLALTDSKGFVKSFSGHTFDNLTVEGCQQLKGASIGVACHFKPEIFMFSVVLMLSTFTISLMLKFFRHTSFFTSKVRNTVADFNAIIAIVAMTIVNILVGIKVPCLTVPNKFEPSHPRSWLVDPSDIVAWWIIPLAALPAAFFSILVMMDQNITSVIINRPDNKLTKGYGYHLDLAVISVLVIICSMLGLPFYVAATVISLLHVDSLRIMSSTAAPGEKPRFLGIREQRVTAFVAHLLIGLAVLLTPAMKYLPMPVLLGVFLYIGVVSLSGQQFGQRILLLLMPTKHQPDYPWLRSVRMKRVHMFTIIQLASFSLLLLVEENKRISMVFPLMLFIMVLIRKVIMERIFTKQELIALDDPVPSWAEIIKPMPRQNANVSNINNSHVMHQRSVKIPINETDEEKISLNKTL